MQLNQQQVSNSKAINNMSRPVSPFIVFCHAKRDELKAANPSANFEEISVLLAKLWRSISQIERDAYVRQSDAGLRRSSRLRNKLRRVDFFGCKL
jgi:hypothetical protein